MLRLNFTDYARYSHINDCRVEIEDRREYGHQLHGWRVFDPEYSKSPQAFLGGAAGTSVMGVFGHYLDILQGNGDASAKALDICGGKAGCVRKCFLSH